MTGHAIYRGSLAILCALQGLATMAIDLNRTHATNPQWPGHARFHVVWQTTSYAALSLLELLLILVPGPLRDQRFYMAAILAGIPMFGFFTSLIARRTFGGTLSDSNGMPPFQMETGGTTFIIDLNLVAETIGALSLFAIVVLYTRSAS